MRCMQNWPSVFIGLRYIRAKRRNGFISFVSLFAFLGIAIGVFALILVLSVMNGFDDELKKRILRVVPHGYLNAEKGIANWPELEQQIQSSDGLLGAAPFIEGNGLISFAGNARGVSILGVNTEQEATVSVVGDFMVTGAMEELDTNGYNVVLGRLVASYLDVLPGDKVTLTLPQVTVTPAGIFPRSRQFTVVGVFEVGAQLDQTLAIISINKAQKLFRRGDRVDGLRLKFDNIYQSQNYLMEMEKTLPPEIVTKDWRETQRNLFEAIKMEKTVVGFLLGIIIAIAAFNIVTTLIMMIAEKRSDIAVLRTMGMTRGHIVGIFMVQGIMLGLMGVALGAVLGVIGAISLSDLVAWLEQFLGVQVFDPNVYFVAHLPSLWKLEDTVWICSGAVIISFLATLYPSYRASQIEPAEALRYDI